MYLITQDVKEEQTLSGLQLTWTWLYGAIMYHFNFIQLDDSKHMIDFILH